METDASTPSIKFNRGRPRQQKKNVRFHLLLWWLQCILFCFAVEGAEGPPVNGCTPHKAQSWPNCLCSVQHPGTGRPPPARGCWWHPALSPCPSLATGLQPEAGQHQCCCCSPLGCSQRPSSLVRRTWGRSHRCSGFMKEEELLGESCFCTVQH